MAHITLAELASAITRRQKAGDLTANAAAAALADLHADFASDYSVVEITAGLIAHAAAIAQRHALRAYDAVRLAAALQTNAAYATTGLPSLTLISADLDLNAAAGTEGLRVDNPNTH